MGSPSITAGPLGWSNDTRVAPALTGTAANLFTQVGFEAFDAPATDAGGIAHRRPAGLCFLVEVQRVKSRNPEPGGEVQDFLAG